MRVNINASIETDAGIEFGGRIRLQYSDGQNTDDITPSASYVYAEASGFRIEVGNANTAYDSAALMYNSEIGFTDRSFGDPNGDYFSFTSVGDDYADDATDDRMGILVSYSVGDLNVRLSQVDPDQTDTSDDPELGISADYAFGAVTVSAAYVDNALGNATADALFLGAQYAFNDAGNVGILYFDYNEAGAGADSTRVTLYGNYTFGATTVAAYVANDDQLGLTTDTAYGLGVSYDLGGARAAFDIHQNYSEDTIAGLGVRFDF
ncbi:MAG: hypothetical protein B7Y02_09200 [Rhodobacterales bacterium 17-64-5]|nr:MAG: hypothetical protein B7Y02_09200 [Rhodobacterales bacterium 17-64-5]